MGKTLCVVQVTIPIIGKKRRKTKVCLMMCGEKNGNLSPSPENLLKILKAMDPHQKWWVPTHHDKIHQPWYGARGDYQVFTFPIKEGVTLNAPHYIQVPLEALASAWGDMPIKY